RPGAMISATTSAVPSSVSWPVLLELIYVVSGGTVELLSAHAGETTYQSGSPEASRHLSSPKVRHGSLPTAGSVQFPFALPSLTPPMAPKASGQGSRPGSSSPVI